MTAALHVASVPQTFTSNGATAFVAAVVISVLIVVVHGTGVVVAIGAIKFLIARLQAASHPVPAGGGLVTQ